MVKTIRIHFYHYCKKCPLSIFTNLIRTLSLIPLSKCCIPSLKHYSPMSLTKKSDKIMNIKNIITKRVSITT